MTKKKTVKKKVTKPVKVVIEEPVVDQGEFKLKEESVVPEPTLLPSEPEVQPVVNPNDPTLSNVAEGFKRPSLTNIIPAYTKKQFEELIEGYWKRFPDMEEKNPVKFEAKSRELERKLKELK